MRQMISVLLFCSLLVLVYQLHMLYLLLSFLCFYCDHFGE